MSKASWEIQRPRRVLKVFLSSNERSNEIDFISWLVQTCEPFGAYKVKPKEQKYLEEVKKEVRDRILIIFSLHIKKQLKCWLRANIFVDGSVREQKRCPIRINRIMYTCCHFWFSFINIFLEPCLERCRKTDVNASLMKIYAASVSEKSSWSIMCVS